MLLAGSIAATALPLTASASINATVTVYDGGIEKPVYYFNLQNHESISPYLNSNNLWGVYYSYNYYDSGCTPPEKNTPPEQKRFPETTWWVNLMGLPIPT